LNPQKNKSQSNQDGQFDEKIKVVSKIERDPGLVKMAKKARNNRKIAHQK